MTIFITRVLVVGSDLRVVLKSHFNEVRSAII